MRIGGREVGPGAPVYVIAEIGVNHDGSASRAEALVDAAAEAGADAVKVQVFEPERLMSRAARLAAYQSRAGERDPVEMLRRLTLPLDAMARIAARAHERGVHAIATVFSLELVAPASRLGWDAFKSASPDIIHRPLLEAMGSTGLPLIVSTGASTLDEVGRAAMWLEGMGERLAMLQCVSAYPTRDDDAAFDGINAIARAVRLPIGYSDHTSGVEAGARAVERGACILEKHLTLDRSLPGPDHAASLEPAMLAEYVALARRARRSPMADAPGVKRVLDCEVDVRLASRQSIVSATALPAGRVLRRADLTFKRPGSGLEPWRIAETVGRRLVADVEADVPISEGDLE